MGGWIPSVWEFCQRIDLSSTKQCFYREDLVIDMDLPQKRMEQTPGLSGTDIGPLCGWYSSRWLCFIIVVCFCVLNGCGQSSDRVLVTGTVHFQQQAVTSGMVRFVPVGDDDRTAGAGRIVDGAYSVKAKGGLVPGAYRVEIQGFKEVPRNENAVPGLAGVPDSKVQILPPHYNTASELERMVEPGRTFEINFDLE